MGWGGPAARWFLGCSLPLGSSVRGCGTACWVSSISSQSDAGLSAALLALLPPSSVPVLALLLLPHQNHGHLPVEMFHLFVLRSSELSGCHSVVLCLSFLSVILNGNGLLLPRRSDDIYFHQQFVSAGGNNVYQNLLQRLFLTVIPLFGLVRLFFNCPADTDLLECSDP